MLSTQRVFSLHVKQDGDQRKHVTRTIEIHRETGIPPLARERPVEMLNPIKTSKKLVHGLPIK